MVIIEVQIDRNIVGDVLLYGNFGTNTIIEKLNVNIELPKPQLAPYNLQMANQTTIKHLGLIWDLWVFIHDIPYNVIFIVMHNIVLNLPILSYLVDHSFKRCKKCTIGVITS